MNSYTSNPDEAENSTGKSMKKNIPGLALLLLDLAVALVGFYIGTHFFWKDQNEESVIVAGAMSAAWATFSWAVFGPMLGRDRSTKFEKGIFLMSMLASWDAGWQWPASTTAEREWPFQGRERRCGCFPWASSTAGMWPVPSS
ncbi:MAG: hypothetical protein ACLR9E_07190 [Bifidobacterium longum]